MLYTAPAKINLYLKVIRRREDGYHEIETLFEKISICDTISLEKAEDGYTEILCDDPAIPVGEGSLLYRTLELFEKYSGYAGKYNISLKKNIPIGAGLGGGSSDAASLLKGLNEINGLPLDEGNMLKIARKLGADIPFFLTDSSFAYGKGRGDIIENESCPIKLSHILVNPGFEVSTKEVYGKVSDYGLTTDIGVDRIFSTFSKKSDAFELGKNLRNDLQTIVLRDFPDLKKVFSELRNAGAYGVLLSGSGPTVFGIFDKEKVKTAADDIGKIFPQEKGWKVLVADTY